MEISRVTGKPIPEALAKERGRLVDAIADSSAHIHGKKFALYGDPDLCLGLAGFLLELGAEPTHVLATNGGKAWEAKVQALFDSSPFGKNCRVYPGRDLWHMRSLLFTEPVDFLIGNTYGKYLERDTGTPLIRIGFPVFDRHHHHRYPVWGFRAASMSWCGSSTGFLRKSTRIPSSRPRRTSVTTSFAEPPVNR